MSKKLTPYSTRSNDYYAAKYVAEASLFYEEKMLQLVDGDREKLRTSVPGVPLPNHLAYKLEPLYSKDGHRMYEFLIEYHTKKPSEGIYYGCRGVTLTGYEHKEEIEQFRAEWELIKSEVCTILNNTFPAKDYSHRFRMTDNANDQTYWVFWISLYEDEDIREVALRAIRIIRSVYERLINGEIFEEKPIPRKKSTDSVQFTINDNNELLKQIKYVGGGTAAEKRQRTQEARKMFKLFIEEMCHQRLMTKNNSYECAWQFLITNVDAARMMLAWFQYMDEQLLFHPASTTYELKVPWAQIARVFLNCDGLAFNSAYLRQYANRSDDDLNGEKLGAWKEKIVEIMKKIRSELA